MLLKIVIAIPRHLSQNESRSNLSTIPSLRVLLDDDMTDNQKREALLSKLDLLDSIDGRKKRLRAAEHAQVYQRQLSRALDRSYE